MSRSISNRLDRIRQFKDELAISAAIRLRTDADEIGAVVSAVVDALLEEYPAQELYVPAPVRYPVAEIRADFAVMSMRALCKKYCVDRRTVYRLLDDENGSENENADQVDR